MVYGMELHPDCLRVEGLGFGVRGSKTRIQGWGITVEYSWFRMNFDAHGLIVVQFWVTSGCRCLAKRSQCEGFKILFFT